MHERTVGRIHQPDDPLIHVRRKLAGKMDDLVFLAENGKCRSRRNRSRWPWACIIVGRYAIARGLGRPLLTSSAIAPATGEPCRDADEILEHFSKFIDLVIDTEQTPASPSTVLEVDGDDITLIREGQGSIEGILDTTA